MLVRSGAGVVWGGRRRERREDTTGEAGGRGQGGQLTMEPTIHTAQWSRHSDNQYTVARWNLRRGRELRL